MNIPLRANDVAVYHGACAGGRCEPCAAAPHRRARGLDTAWLFRRHEPPTPRGGCARERRAGLRHVRDPRARRKARRFNATSSSGPTPWTGALRRAGRANLDAPLFGWSGGRTSLVLAPYGEFPGRQAAGRQASAARACPSATPSPAGATRPSRPSCCAATRLLPRTWNPLHAHNSSFKLWPLRVGIPVIATPASMSFMARDFAAVSFLEDHGDDPAAALAALAAQRGPRRRACGLRRAPLGPAPARLAEAL
jgi:hypothetical protein